MRSVTQQFLPLEGAVHLCLLGCDHGIPAVRFDKVISIVGHYPRDTHPSEQCRLVLPNLHGVGLGAIYQRVFTPARRAYARVNERHHD
jgi:hypothetical protein